ncbi:McrB family protein [Vibrio splendidus]
MKNIVWVHKVSNQAVRTSGGAYIIVPPEVKASDFFPVLTDTEGKLEAEFPLWVCGNDGEIAELKRNILKNGRRDSDKREPEWRLSGDIITYLKNLDNPLTVTLGFYKDAIGRTLFESIPEGSLLNKVPSINKKNKNNKLSDVVQSSDVSPVRSDTNPSFSIDLELSKPFLLLAGISGTGKTRFVRKQVEATGSLNETYCLTSVRPDWHEPSDLLGYVSRLSKDGQAEYITTDVLQFIAKAWRGIFDSGLSVQVHSNEQRGECLVVTGDSQTQQKVRPYWLCLDEMNLAPVEQYFADYLSVLETRSWSWDNDQFIYSSDPLLKPLALGLADEKGDADEVYDRKLRSSLGFDDDKYDELWQLFCQYGLGIPFNLIVAGTVNMDETTHGFSRKVIDRALSIDFGEFFPNDIDEFFEAKKQPLTLGYPIYSQAKLDLFSQVEADSTAEKTKEFFLSVNAVLKGTAFELAYRAFNELCLSVIGFSPKDEDELAAVFDDFLMCKILPRVEGDEDKLTTEDGGALLAELIELLSNQSTLKVIWDGERVDLFRLGIEDRETPTMIGCRSKIKLERMQLKLQSGFTSFWP